MTLEAESRSVQVAPETHLRTAQTFEVGDGVTFLTMYVVLLFAIPSPLVFAPLGLAGAPALLVGVFGAGWWAWYHLHRSTRTQAQAQPVRRAIWLYSAAVLASYVAAMSGPIVESEVSTADFGLVALLGWAGVALVAHDGIPSKHRLETLLNRLAVVGGAMAVLGIIQFVTKQAWVDQIEIPGLSINQTLTSIFGRNGLARPSGTAIHPIEFGVALAMLLPFAVHRAFYKTQASSLRRWAPLLAIATAIPLSISRSAILASAVVLLVLIPGWSRTRQRWAMTLLVGLFGLMGLAVPGMVGTLTRLFTGIGADGSVHSRTDSYTLAWDFIARHPLFGRGISTYLPDYRILDNQYLETAIETGIIGVLALLALVTSGILAAVRTARTCQDEETRHLSMAVAASVAAAGISLAFFDALTFPIVGGLMFLCVGIAGSLSRLLTAELHEPAGTHTGDSHPTNDDLRPS